MCSAAPKAKACICIYLEGAPSQIDLSDPKPKLNELNGQKLPESMTSYRIMAVASDVASRFGSDDAEIVVSKPITIVPALPRFLTTGDPANVSSKATQFLRRRISFEAA